MSVQSVLGDTTLQGLNVYSSRLSSGRSTVALERLEDVERVYWAEGQRKV